MVDRTDGLRIPYLSSTDDILTPGIEQQRALTIDLQLEALIRLLGSGIIEGWELLFHPSLNKSPSIPIG